MTKGTETMSRFVRAQLFVLGCVLLANQAAFAQTFAALSGDTRDASGAVVTGATVTAINVGTNAARSVTTNEAGDYSFPSLPPGIYTVKVERTGFKTVIRNEIELQVQQSARVDFEMQVGQASESIDARGSATLPDSEDATVG